MPTGLKRMLFTAACMLLLCCGAWAQEQIRVLAVADIQYAPKPTRGSRYYADSLKKLESLERAEGKNNFSFMVNLGDSVDSHAENLAPVLEALEKFSCPKRHVMGNHDLADSAENTASDKIEFAVYDPVKPTLQFDGDIAEEVKVGQKIQLPKYTIDDNNPDGVTVYRYIMAPDGTKAKIQEDSVTFTQKGTYVLTFLVTDEHNNATMYRFAVKVK